MIALLLGKFGQRSPSVWREDWHQIHFCVARRLICPLCKLAASVNKIAALWALVNARSGLLLCSLDPALNGTEMKTRNSVTATTYQYQQTYIGKKLQTRLHKQKHLAGVNIMPCTIVRCLHSPVVCRTRLEFPLIRVSLDLPLHPPSIVPHRRVQGALRGVDQPLHIPLDSFHFLIALCQLPVSFTPDLPVQLKLLWLIQGLEIHKTNSINQSDEVHLG